MFENLVKMNDEVAASLIIRSIAKEGTAVTKKGYLWGSTPLFDIIVERVSMQDISKVGYTFYALKSGSFSSGTRALSEEILKDVMKKLLGEAMEASGIYALSGDFSSGLNANVQAGAEPSIYENASRLATALQLNAAQQKGPKAFNQARILSLSSSIVYAGVVRFEEDAKNLKIIIRYWKGTEGNRFMDRFVENEDLWQTNLHNKGGHHQGNYSYIIATGEMQINR